jgi:hypothetical protein
VFLKVQFLLKKKLFVTANKNPTIAAIIGLSPVNSTSRKTVIRSIKVPNTPTVQYLKKGKDSFISRVTFFI